MTGFMIGLDATVMTTTLPTIHTDLHAKYLDPGLDGQRLSLAYAALILTGTALPPGLLAGRDAVHAGHGRVRVSPMSPAWSPPAPCRARAAASPRR